MKKISLSMLTLLMIAQIKSMESDQESEINTLIDPQAITFRALGEKPPVPGSIDDNYSIIDDDVVVLHGQLTDERNYFTLPETNYFASFANATVELYVPYVHNTVEKKLQKEAGNLSNERIINICEQAAGKKYAVFVNSINRKIDHIGTNKSTKGVLADLKELNQTLEEIQSKKESLKTEAAQYLKNGLSPAVDETPQEIEELLKIYGIMIPLSVACVLKPQISQEIITLEQVIKDATSEHNPKIQ